MKLGQYYTFRDPHWLEQALVHRSFAHEANLGFHNERLELLGDSVVGLILTNLLLEKFPQAHEGELSKKRALLVNESSLACLSLYLGLGQGLKLGKGEMASGGPKKPRLLASAFEALVGALFLDAGFNETQRLVVSWLEACWEELVAAGLQDYKTQLQEHAQERTRELPVYEVIEETGPSHDRRFKVQVSLAGQSLAVGEGKSKKSAEQNSAKLALENLK